MNFFNLKNFILVTLLAFVVFSALIFLGDYREIIRSLAQINLTVIVMLLCFSMANYVLRFVRWEFLLRLLDIKIGLVDSISIFVSGFSMALTPVKLGETLKSYLLQKVNKINIKKGLPVVFAERLYDIIGVTLICLLGLTSIFISPAIILILFLFLVSIIFVLSKPVFFRRFLDIFSNIPALRSRINLIEHFYRNLKILISPNALIISSLLSIFSWMFEGIGLFFLLKTFGFEIPVLSILFIYSFASIFGSLTLLPGGIGFTEGSLVYLLTLLGIPINFAVVSTIIIRLTTLWFAILLGMLSLVFVYRKGY